MDDYIDKLTEMHGASEKFMSGRLILGFFPDILDIISHSNIWSILDFGCGKGVQWTEMKLHHAWGGAPRPHMWDPAVPELHHNNPFKIGRDYDLVIATAVLQHVPEWDITKQLWNLFDLTRKTLYLGFVMDSDHDYDNKGDSSEINCSLHSPDWWINRINDTYVQWSERRDRDITIKTRFLTEAIGTPRQWDPTTDRYKMIKTADPKWNNLTHRDLGLNLNHSFGDVGGHQALTNKDK